jgi:ABC-2 type transport system permease protein
MKTIWHILVKEFIQLRRDPKLFPILFIVPVFQLMILGYAANLDVNNIPAAVCDLDRTPASRDFLSRFPNSGYFTFERYADRVADLDPLLDKGAVALAIVIPKGFGKDMAAGRTASVQMIADGADSSYATRGLAYAAQIAASYSGEILLERLLTAAGGMRQAPGGIFAEVRVWYNPELKSRNFMVPGVLGLLLMVVTMMLTSLAIVKEKELGTLEQLIVTPIKPWQLIIGKLTPFALIGLVEIALVLVVSILWFGIPVRGSILLLLVLCMVFLLTTLGLGLLVSTISKTQGQAMMTAAFFIMMPMVFLSGFVFPIENMPKAIQAVTYVMPLRYFFIIIRGIFLKGAGLPELWDESLAMGAIGLLILGMAVARFQKKIG